VSCHIETPTFVGSSSYSVEDSPRRSSFVFWTSCRMHHELEVTLTCGNEKSQLINDNSDRFQMHKPKCYRRSKRREEFIFTNAYSQLQPSKIRRDRRCHDHRSAVELSRQEDATLFRCFCSVYLLKSNDIDFKHGLLATNLVSSCQCDMPAFHRMVRMR
jgi:hypothetical protein